MSPKLEKTQPQPVNTPPQRRDLLWQYDYQLSPPGPTRGSIVAGERYPDEGVKRMRARE